MMKCATTNRTRTGWARLCLVAAVLAFACRASAATLLMQYDVNDSNSWTGTQVKDLQSYGANLTPSNGNPRTQSNPTVTVPEDFGSPVYQSGGATSTVAAPPGLQVRNRAYLDFQKLGVLGNSGKGEYDMFNTGLPGNANIGGYTLEGFFLIRTDYFAAENTGVGFEQQANPENQLIRMAHGTNKTLMSQSYVNTVTGSGQVFESVDETIDAIIPRDQWFHFVKVHDPVLRQVRFYINGALQSSLTTNLDSDGLGLEYHAMTENYGNVGISGREIRNIGYSMTRFYRGALTDAEILGNFYNVAFQPNTNSYPYKMKIQFSGYTQPETLTNFPALVVLNESLTNFLYSQFGSTNGWDLRFRNSDGTQVLNYEIEQWSTGGSSYVWVQVPTLSSASDHIWAYWGNTNTAVTSAPAVYTTNGATWDSTFCGVWHLKEATDVNSADSTTNGNNGSPINSPPTTNAMVDGGLSFNGSTRYVNMSKSTTTNQDNWTLEAWLNPSVLPNNVFYPAMVIYNGSDQYGYGFGVGATNAGGGLGPGGKLLGLYGGYANLDSGYTFPSSNAWYHAVLERSSGTASFYLNGAKTTGCSNSNASPGAVASHFTIGAMWSDPAANTVYRYFSGGIDEAHISNIPRSSNWIWACFMNQGSNSTFNSYSAVQATGGSTLPVTSGLVLWLKGDAGVQTNGTNVTQWDDQSGQNHNVTQGTAGYQPTYATNALNGLPVVRFDGLDDYLQGTPGVNYRTDSFTAFVVAYQSSAHAWNTYLSSEDFRFETSQFAFKHVNGTNLTPTAGALVQTLWKSGSSPCTLITYLNGTQTSTNGSYSSGITDGVNLRIGQDGLSIIGSADPFNGDIAEVILYNTALSSTDLNTVGGYLASKYALSTAYPTLTAPIINNDGGASNITANTATLNGNLSSTGGAPTEVLVYWGTNDGGTTFDLWGNTNDFGVIDVGLITTNVTGLTPSTTYYYRFYATNSAGDAWADSTTNFTTTTAFADWQIKYFGSTNAVNGGPQDDWDGDKAVNWNEYVAGTDPTNSLSCFQIVALTNDASELTLTVVWQSVTDRVYSVLKSTNLVEGWPDATLETNLPGDVSGFKMFPDTNATERSAFYRIKVQKQ